MCNRQITGGKSEKKKKKRKMKQKNMHKALITFYLKGSRGAQRA